MKFRKLKKNEVEARVGSVSAKGCSLLLYKNARVDAKILDETVGSLNWKNDYKLIDGQLFGSVFIYCDKKKEWVEKADVGIESYTEKEKGRASDAFKRACFKWGIGAELYNSPFIWLNAETKKKEKGYGYDLKNKWMKFIVDEFEVSKENEIVKLKIVNDTGKILFLLGGKVGQKEPERTGKILKEETKVDIPYSKKVMDEFIELGKKQAKINDVKIKEIAENYKITSKSTDDDLNVAIKLLKNLDEKLPDDSPF